MKLFRRNKQATDTVPTEIKQYYQPDQRERVGVAWLLAAGVFVLTLALASLVFFGGRWTYNKLANKDTKKPTTAQVAQPASGEQGSGAAGTPAPSSTPHATPSNPTASAPVNTPSTTLPNTGPGDE